MRELSDSWDKRISVRFRILSFLNFRGVFRILKFGGQMSLRASEVWWTEPGFKPESYYGGGFVALDSRFRDSLLVAFQKRAPENRKTGSVGGAKSEEKTKTKTIFSRP